MFGFIARIVGGAVAPLIDQASAFSARFLRKVALFLIAAVCLFVVLGALTLAFFLWVAHLVNPVVAALAVAGLYLIVAIAAVVLALSDGRAKPAQAPGTRDATQASGKADAKVEEEIDQFTAPLMALLARFGLRREQLAVLAGASIAKRLGPLPLVGLAIVGGFLIGRMWKTWRSVLSLDLIASLMSSDLFGLRPNEGGKTDREAA